MPVLLDVVQQLLIFLLSPGPLLQAILVAARRPPHAGLPAGKTDATNTAQYIQHQFNSTEWWGGCGRVGRGYGAALLHAYILPARSLLQCCDDLARTCGLRTCLVNSSCTHAHTLPPGVEKQLRAWYVQAVQLVRYGGMLQ